MVEFKITPIASDLERPLVVVRPDGKATVFERGRPADLKELNKSGVSGGYREKKSIYRVLPEETKNSYAKKLSPQDSLSRL